MANPSRAFHISSRGCFAAASNYGVPRCMTTRPGVGWCVHRHAITSDHVSTTTSTQTSTATQLHFLYSHQRSQLFFERYRQYTGIVKKIRMFTGTTSDNDEKDGRAIVGSGGDNADRNKFTHEVKIEMPNVGDNVTGVIEKWYKKEGDVIKKDEVICDIRTELFTFGMLTDDDYDSIMGVIHVPERSDPMEHGTIICTTFNEGRDSEKDTKENGD